MIEYNWNCHHDSKFHQDDYNQMLVTKFNKISLDLYGHVQHTLTIKSPIKFKPIIESLFFFNVDDDKYRHLNYSIEFDENLNGNYMLIDNKIKLIMYNYEG